MKRMTTLFLIISIVVGSIWVEASAQEIVSEESYMYLNSSYGRAAKILEIAYGENEENLRRTEFVEDCEIITPKSFTIDEDGNFYFLDTLNSKIKKYSISGEYLKSIVLPDGIYGLDIEKVNNYLFIYGDDEKLYVINENFPEEYSIVMSIARENIASLASVGNELFVRSYNNSDMRISIPNEVPATLMSLDKTLNCFDIAKDDMVIGLGNKIEVSGRSLTDKVTYQLSCRVAPMGAYCIKKVENVIYTLSNETDWKYAETRVTKIENGNVAKNALTISGKEYDYGFPFKKICVHKDSVYQMVPEAEGVSVYLIPWTSELETRITDDMVAAYNVNISGVSLADRQTVAASFSVTRAEAIQRAEDMCWVSWRYDALTMHTPTTSTTTSPTHLGTTSITVSGIPYCWGGMNGIDTATYTGSSRGYLQNFSDCLNSGKTAGNINSNSSSWVSGTFGIDCSGLICSAFKISSKVGTGTLAGYFEEGNWPNAQSGDVAIYPNRHTFMVKTAYFSESSGFYMLTTYESTTDGSTQCAKTHSRDYPDVCNQYTLYTY